VNKLEHWKRKLSKKMKLGLIVLNLVLFAFMANMFIAEQKPIPSAQAAATIVMPKDGEARDESELTTVRGDAAAAGNNDMNVTNEMRNGLYSDGGNSGRKVIEENGFQVVLDSSGNVIGWERKALEDENIPLELPSRNVRTDENGETVIEIDDPDSLILDQKLYEVEKLPEIRDVDRKAITLAQGYSSANKAPEPFIAENNGRINFYFGTMNPRIICRPLRLTDIELEPGEQVKNVHISDSARWSVSGAWSGELDELVTHVILRPQLPDIAANLLIHTNKRTYSIELISLTTEEYMPFVGFIYPERPRSINLAEQESWNDLLDQYQLAKDAEAAKMRDETTNNARYTDASQTYTDYAVKVTRGKNIAWLPKSVYDAGGKTYVVMPEKMQITEAPIFFIKQNGKEKLTNYRVEGDKYIIDRVFDLGIMTIGKDRVAIIRKKTIGATENPQASELPASAPPLPETRKRVLPDNKETEGATPASATPIGINPERPGEHETVTPDETAGKETPAISDKGESEKDVEKPIKDRNLEEDWETLVRKYGVKQ
jgi:type IV secretion system protein VirB9